MQLLPSVTCLYETPGLTKQRIQGFLYKRTKKAIFLSFFHDFFAGFWAVYLIFHPSSQALGLGPGPAKKDGFFFLSERVFQAVVRDFDYFLAASAAKNCEKGRDQVGR